MNKKRLTFITIGFLLSFVVKAQSIARGYVYEDTNGNGKKERREKDWCM